MTTAAPSTALAMIQPAFTDAERLALAGYLAGYRGLTHDAYALDLRQFTTWCRARSLDLFAVRRADIESFTRELEARGRARATVTRRLCTIAGFYRYALEEELLDHSPAAHVRRPRVDYESHTAALDRNELGALARRRGSRPGVRARADLAARAERPAGLGGHRRGHRAAGPGARAPDADDHAQGRQGGHHPAGAAHRPGDRPGHRRAHRRASVPGRGQPPARDRHGAGRIVRTTARRAGIAKAVTPHTLRHAFITAAVDAGVPLRATCRRPPRTPTRERRCGTTAPAAAWTGTPPILSPPTSAGTAR